MSISDITLNDRVYSLSSTIGTSLIRKCSKASLPEGLHSSTLEISHAAGSGNKPDRHLAKFVDTVIDSVTGAKRDYLTYVVAQVPKGGSSAEQDDIMGVEGATNSSMAEVLTTLLSGSGFVTRLINGEFS